MTQEDKDLLFKYLCMALPYEVKISTPTIIGRQDEIRVATAIHKFEYYSSVCGDNFGWDNIEMIKPYLRPMSSMTDEEKEEMHNLLSPEGTAIYENDGIALPINHCGEFVPYEFMNCIIQYLLKNHFDFMGLISKDLAIEVTEENNPYEN